jgi:hypothetical protein
MSTFRPNKSYSPIPKELKKESMSEMLENNLDISLKDL